MKAKEYYAKYKDRIASSDDAESLKGISDMVYEFCMDAKEISEKRKIRTDSGAVSMLRELNDKYNAVCRMFEKDFGVSPIKENGFMNYWRREIPELDQRLGRKENDDAVSPV